MLRRGSAARIALVLVAWTWTATAWAQTPDPTPKPEPAPDPTAEFFDDNAVHEIRLMINPNWDQLKLEFQQNTYYGCHFVWKGQED